MLKTQQQAIASSRRGAWGVATVPPMRARRVCRAAEDKPPEPESFQEPSGFVAYDSAGQSNMYPVFTKAYANTGPDDNANATNGIALGAGAVAVGAIVVGLLALGFTGSDVTTDQYKSLSEYASIFAAQL